jgi:hypothetical protein
MDATAQLRLHLAHARRADDLAAAAQARLTRIHDRGSTRRAFARQIGSALIRLGETLAEPNPGPARAR